MQKTVITLSETNRRIGSCHPRARLTDEEVDLIHELRETGLSLEKIARKFDATKGAIWKITTGLRRAQTVARWVTVDADGKRRTVAGEAPARAGKSVDAVAARDLSNALAAWR
ncbi:MAG: hypothetical protein QUV35_07470 [Hydrogenophaga sp.]|uniref:hypothetical protein n=1 Tax=Hydrogenophaga sp. TaxID=1904254 RepID=UPI00260E144E|nr:hypothetical protein [Hydrogenophaga sp.]MDM7942452.1 hypothetical protein [Hydrogenophaga sp.]